MFGFLLCISRKKRAQKVVLSVIFSGFERCTLAGLLLVLLLVFQ